MPATTPFVHRIRVRYVECDMQGVVFNAHYLSYVDDAMDLWLTDRLGSGYLKTSEYAVKKASVEWFDSVTAGDVLDIVPVVQHWGTTSMTIGMEMTAGGRGIAEAQVVAVGVRPGTHEPTSIREEIRTALSVS